MYQLFVRDVDFTYTLALITDVTHPIVKVNYKDEYRTTRNI
jgi:hypothetical protein